MGNYKLEKIKCNLCGKSDSYPIYKKRIKRGLYTREKFYPTSMDLSFDTIVKCKSCGLVFVNPRLNSNIILNFYKNGKDERYITHKQERTKTFERIIALIEKFSKSRGYLLEIGCGAGFLMSLAKKKAWKVKGIEPNRYFAEYARNKLGLDIINRTVEEVNFSEEYFDVIILWDTIEHLTDPNIAIKKASLWLKKDGILLINTPNLESIFAKLLRRRWWFISTMHLYYFTPDTIRKYLKNANLKCIKIMPYFQTLKLGYLVSKIKVYSQISYLIFKKIIDTFKLNDLPLTYYAGQMTVIAKKY